MSFFIVSLIGWNMYINLIFLLFMASALGMTNGIFNFFVYFMGCVMSLFKRSWFRRSLKWFYTAIFWHLMHFHAVFLLCPFASILLLLENIRLFLEKIRRLSDSIRFLLENIRRLLENIHINRRLAAFLIIFAILLLISHDLKNNRFCSQSLWKVNIYGSNAYN